MPPEAGWQLCNGSPPPAAFLAACRVWPVTGDWLIDSIAYGRLQPEAGYAPPPPQGGAAGGFGGGGEAGGVGPHSNMPSADTTRSGGASLAAD